jgi:integrase
VSLDEVQALINAMPERMRPLVVLGAWGGLRRGEMLGLQRQDIDLLKGTIRIDRSAQEINNRRVIGPPKTRAGFRTLHIPESTLELLKRHLDSFVGSQPDAWILTGEKGQPLNKRMITKYWNQARKSINRTDLHLHDLRHFHLTLVATQGATTKEIMARAGHSTPRAALIYQHATDDRDRTLANLLEPLAKSQLELK